MKPVCPERSRSSVRDHFIFYSLPPVLVSHEKIGTGLTEPIDGNNLALSEPIISKTKTTIAQRMEIRRAMIPHAPRKDGTMRMKQSLAMEYGITTRAIDYILSEPCVRKDNVCLANLITPAQKKVDYVRIGFYAKLIEEIRKCMALNKGKGISKRALKLKAMYIAEEQGIADFNPDSRCWLHRFTEHYNLQCTKRFLDQSVFQYPGFSAKKCVTNRKDEQCGNIRAVLSDVVQACDVRVSSQLQNIQTIPPVITLDHDLSCETTRKKWGILRWNSDIVLNIDQLVDELLKIVSHAITCPFDFVSALQKVGGDERFLDQNLIEFLPLSSIRRLALNSWLDDQVINWYVKFLSEKLLWKSNLHYITSILMTGLCTALKNGETLDKKVRTWCEMIDVNKIRKIFIPVHRSVHWTLFVVDVNDWTAEYYDSLFDIDPSSSNDIATEFLPPLNIFLKQAFPLKRDLTLQLISSPQQEGYNDCGMFVMGYIFQLSQNLNIHDITQEKIPNFRRCVAENIFTKELGSFRF